MICNCSFAVGSGTFKKGKPSTVHSSSTNSNQKKKKHVGTVLKQSTGFVKRIARLPSKDREQVLKVIRKQQRKRKVVSKATKWMSISTSTSTNTSNVSVNKAGDR